MSNMNKTVPLLCLLLAIGVTVAQATEEDADKTAIKTQAVEAEVVSVDVEGMTITIKGETENKTLPVAETALASLEELAGGEKVTLTCEDDEKGEHRHVVAIEAKTPEAPEKE
jgi:hypothetical protein